MPYRDKEIEKLYYSVGEVGKMFGVKASLIRFWEMEFEEVRPKKSNRTGNRQFMKKDIETIRRIHHLLKVRCFTIKGAKLELMNSND